MKIKTESREVQGLLKDIRVKSFVRVCENNQLKIVPRDKIEIMEVAQINKNESLVAEYNSKLRRNQNKNYSLSEN